MLKAAVMLNIFVEIMIHFFQDLLMEQFIIYLKYVFLLKCTGLF